jgi:HK97 family phage major capsid protein
VPVLTEDQVTGYDERRTLRELDELRSDVASIREKNGGTIVGLKGADAQTVSEHMQSMNVLGEHLDTVRAQGKNEADFQRFSEFMQAPDEGQGGHHPGHGTKAQTKAGAPKDIGGLFLQSDAWKAFKESASLDRISTVPIESLWANYQGIGEVPADGAQLNATLFQSTDYPIQPQFISQPVETLYQPNNIGPLFAQGTTDSNTIRYPVETVTSTGAAEVAEAGTKPEAQLSFAPVDEPVRKIAVLLPLTDESLDDVPLLRAYINARLRLFVQMREDLQLLSGNGTAPNLKGVLNRSGINTATSYSIGGANPDQALVDAVFHAAMRVRDAFLEPDAAVIKPSTWEIAALAKDANRNYLLGGPGAAGYAGSDPVTGPRLWGLRVVLNANMPAQVATNKVVLVGAFAAGGMVIRKGGIDLAVSDSHSTFFAENKVMLRAEERLALAIFRPAAFATVTSAA